MSADEANFTGDEQAAFDRVNETFGADTVVVGKFEPFPGDNEDDPEGEPTLLEEADAALAPDPETDRFRLVPLDFTKLLVDGIPEAEYLDFPYLPRGARVWVFAPAESGKTIYFEWAAAKLTREGRTVVFVSAENPLSTDVDRVGRLRPDFERLRFYHMPGLDLADRSHFLELATACSGADLLVLDTLSALWSSDEASNAEVVKLDRDVLAQLVRLTGITVVVIHHMGHPQAFVNRGGAGAGRGASAMGQKADVVLVFQAVGVHEFTIDHAKNRTAGGHKQPKARFRIVDTDDGGLDIEHVGKAIEERVVECMDAAVEVVIGTAEGLGTNALRAALAERGFGGATWSAAVAELRAEDPVRVRQVDGVVIGADGKHRKGKPWTAA
jgi:KaiC/GvpD/RAD55 family RecA-like ATPase